MLLGVSKQTAIIDAHYRLQIVDSNDRDVWVPVTVRGRVVPEPAYIEGYAVAVYALVSSDDGRWPATMEVPEGFLDDELATNGAEVSS